MSRSRIDDIDTPWSLLLQGKDRGHPRFRRAWEGLYLTYERAIRLYVVKLVGDRADGEEWAQDFMDDWYEGSLSHANQEEGSFRKYLKSAIHHYVKRRLARLRRQLPLDDDVAAREAEEEFDRRFFQGVLKRAIQGLRDHQRCLRQARREEKNVWYDLFHAVHIEPTENETPRPRQEELARRFGLSPKAVERQLQAARRKLRELCLRELRAIAPDPERAAAEYEALQRFLKGAIPPA